MPKILLVDDNKFSLEYYTYLLSEKGYLVLSALDGTDALVKLSSNNDIDLIITDLQMPPGDWGGIWLVRELQALSINIPVIVLSEKGSISKAIESIKLGAKEFVEKSNAENELISVIEKTLSISRLSKISNELSVKIYYNSLKKRFGNIWDRFENETKMFLANSEHLYHNHTHDISFDFSVCIIEIAKSIEVEFEKKFVNKLIELDLNNTKDPSIEIKDNNGNIVSISNYKKGFTIGQIIYLLKHKSNYSLLKELNKNFSDITRLTDFLQDLLNKYRRNDAAHKEFISISSFEHLRNCVLGISSESPFKILYSLYLED